MVLPAFDVVQIPALMILLISSFDLITAKINIMPPFRPNEHMVRKFSDKGSQEWEIYSWCVRDAISKRGDFLTTKIERLEKLKYQDFM
jgi:hypothetical protein